MFKDVKYKYSEDQMLKEVGDYIRSTYQQHYVTDEGDQTIDVWAALGSVDTTARDTAIKYLMRYGKKEGFNKKDLLKAIHYILLMMYFTQGYNKQDGDTKPTFLTERDGIHTQEIPANKPTEYTQSTIWPHTVPGRWPEVRPLTAGDPPHEMFHVTSGTNFRDEPPMRFHKSNNDEDA